MDPFQIRLRARLVFAVVSTAAAGCATGLRPGVDQEPDVLRTMGPPTLALPAPEGRRQLAYATGPFGTRTTMVYLARDGKVDRVEQVLTDERFQSIRPNATTQEDVLLLIGPPKRRVRFDNLRQVAWDYRFQDTWGYFADFSVMIDERGIVASKVTVRVEPRESGFSR